MTALTTRLPQTEVIDANTKPETETKVQKGTKEPYEIVKSSAMRLDTRGPELHEDPNRPLPSATMHLPITAPTTPCTTTPGLREENPLGDGGHSMLLPTGTFARNPNDDIRHHPSQNLPATPQTSLIPDTPLSWSPNLKEQDLTSNTSEISVSSYEQKTLEASPHAEKTHEECMNMTSLVKKNEGAYSPVFIDFERRIGLAEIVAVSK